MDSNFRHVGIDFIVETEECDLVGAHPLALAS